MADIKIMYFSVIYIYIYTLTSWPLLHSNTYNQIYLKATREFGHHSITTQNDVKYEKWVYILRLFSNLMRI